MAASVNEQTTAVCFLVMWILTSIFWCYSNGKYALASCVTTKFVGFVGSIIVQPTKYCCISLGLSCALTFFFGHNPSPAKSVLMYFSAHQIRLSANSWILKFLFWKLANVHKPRHPLKGLQQPHVFFFPLTLQTMAWFWEHRWVHPMAVWILGDFLYPSSPLTNQSCGVMQR